MDGAFTAWRGEAATLKSSLGFEADSDDRAKTDVGALVEALEAQNTYTAAGVEFMDANNVKHPLNLEQLQVLNQEIISAGLAAYDYKWKTRDAIDDAKTKEGLAKIKIKFVPVDFTAA
nr:DUF4376 domain-containing protein [Duodenibacillus massiliensis]